MEPKAWHQNYPEGIEYQIDPDEYASLKDLLEVCLKKYSSLPAYESMGKTLSFAELDQLSTNFAAFLQKDLGMRKGDKIAIQMPNLLQWTIAMFGAIKAGLIVVNTNPLYTAREMEHQFKDANITTVVILANFAHNLEKIIEQTAIRHVIITEIGDMLGGLKKPLVNAVVKYVKKMVPAYKLKGTIRFGEALRKGAAQQLDPVEVTGDDIAYLQYTGGTTGVSKGAMLSHRNMVANMQQISQWMKPRLVEKEEIVITALPLYHIFALTVNCLSMLKIGAFNVLITNPRDMPAFIKTLGKFRFSVITGVNTLFNAMLNQQAFASLDFSALKVAVGGGMAVQDTVANKWKEITGTPLVEGYGLTETAPVLTCNPIDGTERIGTIGLPLPSTDVVLLDDEGVAVPKGEPGEICAKGPQVMKGYWEKPAETQNAFINGYFKTGDIGMELDGGFYRIVDRKKEMINVSGFNVYPNEIENVVASHPKVLEVGAIGVSDAKSTEKVKLFVVRKDESLTEEELISFCRENMTAYKVPKFIEFRAELPKSNVGKILRRVLKEEEESKQRG